MLRRGLILGGVLVLFFGVFVSSAFADNNVDFSITIRDAALQLTVPPTANLDLTPTSTNADFKSTNLTVSVGTNNATGYTLTMSVPSTDISRIGAASGDPVISTLGNQAGGYSENDFTANKWGYKITGNNYFPITTTLSPSQWITDGPANSVDNTITLASKVNTAIPAGTYKTTLTFSAVANPGLDASAFNIIYNPNGGTGTMSPTTIAYGQSGTIASSIFTAPTGYVFDGWASTARGGAPYFDAGVPYTAPVDATGETYKVLYAMWKKTGTPTPSGGSSGTTPGTTLQRAYEIAYTAAHKGMYEEDTAGSGTFHYVDSWNGATYEGSGRDVRFLIQDMTPEICASATALNSEALVLDIRDQTSYHIIKGADGRCWMQDNLALDLVNVSLGSLKGQTNATDEVLEYLKGVRTGTASDRYATSGVSEWASSWSYSVPFIHSGDKNNTNSTITINNVTIDSSTWKFGIFYNYCAASAGSYCNGNNSTYYDPTDRPNTAIDSEYDICPLNWRLPTGGWRPDQGGESDGGELDILSVSYTPETSFYIIPALHIPMTGYFGDYRIYDMGGRGEWWSSTRSSDKNMNVMNVSPNGINARANDPRDVGFSVRCIAR